jgi:hypothetical protein
VGGGVYSGIEIIQADVRTDSGEAVRASRSSPLLGVMATFGTPLVGPLWLFATPRVGFVLSPTTLYVNEENAGETGILRLGLFVEFATKVNSERHSQD